MHRLGESRKLLYGPYNPQELPYGMDFMFPSYLSFLAGSLGSVDRGTNANQHACYCYGKRICKIVPMCPSTTGVPSIKRDAHSLWTNVFTSIVPFFSLPSEGRRKGAFGNGKLSA